MSLFTLHYLGFFFFFFGVCSGNWFLIGFLFSYGSFMGANPRLMIDELLDIKSCHYVISNVGDCV